MAYLGSFKIDDYLTFPANTHDPDTGVATDADAVPAYRIYEDETGTPIVTGDMAKLDDANTTGFYTERLQLTAASGFEKGKCYTIYIQATVDSDVGTMSHTFQIEAEVDANVVSDKTGYGLADDAITASKFDESTAFPLAAGDTGATQVARVGADSDTLETLSDQIDGAALEAGGNLATVLADTNELQTDWVNDGRLDALIDAIKAKTDNLPADPADDSDIDGQLATIAAYLDTEIAAIKAVTDNLPDAGALNDLATILADTGELQTDWANGGRLDLLIDAIKAKTDNLKDAWNDLAAGAVGDAVLDEVVETLTLRKIVRILLSVLAGKSSGGGTTTFTARDYADAKARVTATLDANGNRTAMTLDGD